MCAGGVGEGRGCEARVCGTQGVQRAGASGSQQPSTIERDRLANSCSSTGLAARRKTVASD